MIRLIHRKRESPELTGSYGGDDFDDLYHYHGGSGVSANINEAMTDLLRSDPDDFIEGWSTYSRGVGWIFGFKVVDIFNHFNGLELICRAH